MIENRQGTHCGAPHQVTPTAHNSYTGGDNDDVKQPMVLDEHVITTPILGRVPV